MKRSWFILMVLVFASFIASFAVPVFADDNPGDGKYTTHFEFNSEQDCTSEGGGWLGTLVCEGSVLGGHIGNVGTYVVDGLAISGGAIWGTGAGITCAISRSDNCAEEMSSQFETAAGVTAALESCLSNLDPTGVTSAIMAADALNGGGGQGTSNPASDGGRAASDAMNSALGDFHKAKVDKMAEELGGVDKVLHNAKVVQTVPVANRAFIAYSLLTDCRDNLTFLAVTLDNGSGGKVCGSLQAQNQGQGNVLTEKLCDRDHIKRACAENKVPTGFRDNGICDTGQSNNNSAPTGGGGGTGAADVPGGSGSAQDAQCRDLREKAAKGAAIYPLPTETIQKCGLPMPQSSSNTPAPPAPDCAKLQADVSNRHTVIPYSNETIARCHLHV